MRIAILDPAAGVSGDMMLGALLDVGLEPAWLRALPTRLGLPDVGVEVRQVQRAGLRAMKVDFVVPTGPEGAARGRTIGELIQLVQRAAVSTGVRERAARAFQLLGEAEGRVHGVAPDRVHLHEVGALDAVLDIVGAIEGFDKLGVETIYHLPVAVGTGWVDSVHGRLPVPAPATAYLLQDLDVAHGGPVSGEATTPTGAVLLRVLSRGTPPSRWRLVATGWGAGARDPREYPNALRLYLAEVASEAGVVEVIVTDVDDMSPEYVDALRRALTAAGALDAQAWATQGKKGRPSLRIEVLAPLPAADRVVTVLFEHSTTTGIRRWTATRATLAREDLTVELPGAARVRVKVRQGPSGPRLKAEYEDVVAAAAALGEPALDVARAAEQLARELIDSQAQAPDSANKGVTE